ncbi:MAG: sigma-70 family RNA polymerase sigma factor [Planctomycetes bacterium]|nr:sigma-70 family RNA polymerase sigma factor [Planctomycetota bacterium]
MATGNPSSDDAILGELAWVRRLAGRMLRDDALADDVAQDVWLAARDRAPVDTGSGLRRWLGVVTRNRVRRLVRGERRRIVREQFAAGAEPVDVAAPPDVVERAALHRATMDAVMGLDEPYREALLLRHLDDLPATEIAVRQGISHAAARQRLSRAMQMLRERLERTHPGGFAAWCVAWSRDLFPGPAAAVGSSLLVMGLAMKVFWIVCGLVVASSALWFSWPADPAPVPVARANDVADPSAASSAGGSPLVSPADRAAIPAAAAVVVTVVDGAARAVPGVHVVSLRGGEALRDERTGDDGRATFGSPAVGDEWLLAAPGRIPLRVACDGRDEQRLEWPLGDVVQGIVQRGVKEDVRLVLRLEHDAPAPGWSGLGARAVAILAELGLTMSAMDLRPADDGAFTFAGLATEWSGALSAGPWAITETSRLAAVDDGHTVLLRGPVRGLVLELAAPVPVRGRVVADGTPVAGLSVQIDGLLDRHAPVASCTTGSDGTFVALLRRALRSKPVVGALTVVAPEAGGMLSMQRVTVAADAEQHDVGDIVVGAPLSVRVVDAASVPIQGAHVAVVDGAGFASGVSSGTDGEARFVATPADASDVVVEAPGASRRHARIPAERRLVVTLARANGITVLVRDRQGSAMRGTLRVRADRLPFVAAAEGTAAAAVQEIASQPFDQLFPLGRAGEVALDALVPGVLLHLSALDTGGQQVAAVDAIAPPAERRDTVRIDADVTTQALRCIVRDERGRPVARARVHVEAGELVDTGRTDARGEFAFTSMQNEVRGVHFEVVHPAFVPFVRNDAVMTPGGTPIEVTLVEGRRLTARVRQQNGRPVTAWYVTIGGGATGLATATGEGEYVFDVIARAAGEITVALVGGRTFTHAVNATDELVDVRLPDLADIDVVLGEAVMGKGGMLSIVVTPIEPAGTAERRPVRPDERSRGAATMQLAPGRYRVQLERREPGRRGAEALGSPRELDVGPGANVRVSLP